MTEGAKRISGERVATLAVTNLMHGARQCLAQTLGAVTIVLQQMQRHPLRRLGTYAGQAAQSLGQFIETAERFQRGIQSGVFGDGQNGSFSPGGRPRPALMPAIFSCETASTLRTASLTAAAMRSSSMSLSSVSSDGSIVTRLTSWRPVISTLTSPAPAWPSTSVAAIASCAFFMFSCTTCACFI